MTDVTQDKYMLDFVKSFKNGLYTRAQVHRRC